MNNNTVDCRGQFHGAGNFYPVAANYVFMLVAILLSMALFGCADSASPAPMPTTLSSPIPLVEIHAGEFMMGSPKDEEGRSENEGTPRPVNIDYSFWIGKTEVTQKQWLEVMGTTVQQQRNNAHKLYTRRSKTLIFIQENLGKILEIDEWPMPGIGDDYPMYYINWDEAMVFCAQLTKQERAQGRLPSGYEYCLPTETEWEYACRAGSTTRFANGNLETDIDAIGWYDGNSRGAAHPVGEKSPNAWGVYDMHGNVWEWCSNPREMGRGYYDYTNHIIRGGSWETLATACSAATRADSGLLPPQKYTLGFRVVLIPTSRLSERGHTSVNHRKAMAPIQPPGVNK